MPTEATDLIQIGADTFELAPVTIKRGQRVKQPDGKNKVQEVDHVIISPPISTVAQLTCLFNALLVGAEATEAGNGVALGQALLQPRIEDASDEAFNLETGESDAAKYLSYLISPRRPSSAGQTLGALNAELAAATPELLSLASKATSRDGWQEILDESGAQRFKSQDSYLVRFVELQQYFTRISSAIEAKNKRQAEMKAKRDEKAKAAAKLAAAEAAATK